MREPFAWGINDCCIFAADGVIAVSGNDPASDLRGTYSSAIAAARVLKDIGGIEGAGDRTGERIPPLNAQVGDVGLITAADPTGAFAEALAVCTGELWVAPSERGLHAHQLTAARLAWRVARCHK
jgi:hypothetical protein